MLQRGHKNVSFKAIVLSHFNHSPVLQAAEMLLVRFSLRRYAAILGLCCTKNILILLSTYSSRQAHTVRL